MAARKLPVYHAFLLPLSPSAAFCAGRQRSIPSPGSYRGILPDAYKHIRLAGTGVRCCGIAAAWPSNLLCRGDEGEERLSPLLCFCLQDGKTKDGAGWRNIRCAGIYISEAYRAALQNAALRYSWWGGRGTYLLCLLRGVRRWRRLCGMPAPVEKIAPPGGKNRVVCYVSR